MSHLTLDDLKSKVSDTTRRLNPELFKTSAHQALRAPQGAKPQPPLRPEPMAAPKREALYPGRVQIRITSVRARLCDPDNLCAKYFVDALRYAGLIKDDRAQDIEYSIRQRKRGRTEEEHTQIEIIPL